MNSKKKKNNKMKFNNKGFTLIELLVVITLISLVFSISTYFISGAIRKAKEKTYLTTINEIEKAAGNYLLENSDKLYFIKSSDIEYQCVTVKDLIDYGFLNEDVTESKVNDDNTVGKDNYIYIERNTSTKAVEKNVYITELDSSYGNICTASVNASGGIYFDYETGWSKQKNVNITYELSNVSNINNYKFGYKYTLQNGTILLNYSNDSEMHKTISNLDKAGSVYADIIYDNDTSNKVNESTKSITKFDNTGPTISVEPHEYRYFSKKIVVSLFVNDCTNEGRNCSGVKSDYTSSELETIKNNKIVVKVGNNPISSNNIALTKISTNVYKLEINNSEYDGEVSIRVLENAFVDKVVDEEKNGNVETLLNPYFKFDNTAPTAPNITNNYNSNNWYNKSKYAAGVQYKLSASTTESGSGVNNWQYTYATNATETSTNVADQNNKWIIYTNNSECATGLTCITNPFTTERNGTDVYIRVCDKAGNCSNKSSTKIYLDITPPTAPNITNNYNNNNWYNKAKYDDDVQYKLSAFTTESGSGVNNWQYTYATNATETSTNVADQNNKWIIYTNNSECATGLTCITNPFTTERNGTDVYIRVCDKAGNCSNKSSTEIYLDITPPNTDVTVWKDDTTPLGTDYYSETNSTISKWITSSPTLKFSASDSVSGLTTSAELYWNKWGRGTLNVKIDSNNTLPWNDNEIIAKISSQGYRYLYLDVCDVAGNCKKQEVYFKFDNVAPTVNFSMYNGNSLINEKSNGKNNYYVYNSKASSYPSSNTNWIETLPYIKFTVYDNLSNNVDYEHNSLGYNNQNDANNLNSIYGYGQLTDITSSGDNYYIGYSVNTSGRRYFTFNICDNSGLCTTKHLYFMVAQDVNAIKYNCALYNDNDNSSRFRLRVMNVTRCGESCNYNKLNGLSSGFSLDVNNPISMPASIDEYLISDTLSGLCSSEFYTVNNSTFNCYNGVSTGSNVKTTIGSDCSKFVAYRTTMKINTSGSSSWYYISDKDCYVQDTNLTSNKPISCYNENDKFHVTFSANGGSWSDGSTTMEKEYYPELRLNTISKPTKSGCSFSKWKFNGASRTNYIDFEENGGVLYADWYCGGGSSTTGNGDCDCQIGFYQKPNQYFDAPWCSNNGYHDWYYHGGIRCRINENGAEQCCQN